MQKQPTGRTFLIAMILFGCVAAGLFIGLANRALHPQASGPTASALNTPVPLASGTPSTVTGNTENTLGTQPSVPLSPVLGGVAGAAGRPKEGVAIPRPTADPAVADAEKELLASLPKPTPLPVRRTVTVETRVNDLVNLARTLRDRGDTGTALTRLREAQVISPNSPLIISEMAITYENMGLAEKAIAQWRRIYEIGAKAGIYYAAAEAKLQAYELPSVPPPSTPGISSDSTQGGLHPESMSSRTGPILSLGTVAAVDDTGKTQPQRHFKLRVPIIVKSGQSVDVPSVVIQVYFYDQLADGSVVETNANVSSSWAHRVVNGSDVPVDWSSPQPEVLEVEYTQPEPDKKDPRTMEPRNFFGYVVRVYYKAELNAASAEPVKLLQQFPPPTTLTTSDLPQ